MTWWHTDERCSSEGCYCADPFFADPVCEGCYAPGWACECHEARYEPGDRVFIPSIQCEGVIQEHVPERGGYLVQPDNYPHSGGFGYGELRPPLPKSPKTRWDRILNGDL